VSERERERERERENNETEEVNGIFLFDNGED
jgi:hypothetical protein